MSFAKLFKSSKFACLHPQQLIAPAKDGHRIEWGLKGLITPDGKRASNLPVSIWKENFPLPDRPFPLPITSNINAPIKYYNDVVHSNIELCGPEFAKEKLSGRKLRQLQSKVRLLDPKFKFLDSENRLLSEVDHLTPLSDQPKYIGDLSEAEFKKLLVKAKKLWLQFDDLVERGIYSSEEWYKLLNVSPHPLSSFDADGTGASFVHPPTYLSKEYVAREKDKDPELAELIPEQEYIKVQGRVLNRVTGGYSVGIAGYVAFCSVMNYEMDRAHRLTSTSTMRHFYEDFWVLDARLDRNGKPEIHVSRRDPRVNARMQGKKFFSIENKHYIPGRREFDPSQLPSKKSGFGAKSRENSEISKMLELLRSSSVKK